jgi:hypothetical protein
MVPDLVRCWQEFTILWPWDGVDMVSMCKAVEKEEDPREKDKNMKIQTVNLLPKEKDRVKKDDPSPSKFGFNLFLF